MSKVLTDKEMLAIVSNAVLCGFGISDSDAYRHFIEDFGDLIANHFGADRNHVSYDACDELGWTCSFWKNENTPPGGGVFAMFDTDVSWDDDEETETEES